MIETGETAVPAATVARLPQYLRALRDLQAVGVRTTSSTALAEASGVGSAQLRKDLSYLGSFGTRGVGYDVASLSAVIAESLGLGSVHRLAIIGIGNLGHALANYSGYTKRGFEVVALLDVSPEVVGTRPAGRLVVEPLDALEDVLAREAVTMVVIATPGPAAQAVAERCGCPRDSLVRAGGAPASRRRRRAERRRGRRAADPRVPRGGPGGGVGGPGRLR